MRWGGWKGAGLGNQGAATQSSWCLRYNTVFAWEILTVTREDRERATPQHSRVPAPALTVTSAHILVPGESRSS